MFLFGGSSPQWLISASGCGIYGCVSNAYHAGYLYLEYGEDIGSRTIIGYVTTPAVYSLMVFSSQVVVMTVIMEAVDGIFLLLVYITVRSILPLLMLRLVL